MSKRKGRRRRLVYISMMILISRWMNYFTVSSRIFTFKLWNLISGNWLKLFDQKKRKFLFFIFPPDSEEDMVITLPQDKDFLHNYFFFKRMCLKAPVLFIYFYEIFTVKNILYASRNKLLQKKPQFFPVKFFTLKVLCFVIFLKFCLIYFRSGQCSKDRCTNSGHCVGVDVCYLRLVQL